MARMRSVKPEFWSDQDLARLPRDVRMLYLAMWNFADEQCRMPGDPRLIKAECFPLDDDVTSEVVVGWLDVLDAAGKAVRYEVDGSQYVYLPKMGKHQKLDPRLESRHPAPPAETPSTPIRTNQSVRTGVQTPTAHRLDGAKHVAGGREHVAGGRGQERAGARTPATRIPEPFTVTDEMLAWSREQGYADEWASRITESFVDYWRAKPGKDGRKTDWPATWRNWLRRDAERSPFGRASPQPQQSRNALILQREYERAEAAERNLA